MEEFVAKWSKGETRRMSENSTWTETEFRIGIWSLSQTRFSLIHVVYKLWRDSPTYRDASYISGRIRFREVLTPYQKQTCRCLACTATTLQICRHMTPLTNLPRLAHLD
eukprot:30683_3